MESKWKVEILPRAARELDQLREVEGERAYNDALDDILGLEDDPLPEGYVHLRRTKDFYRVYTHRSKYRIVYRVLYGKRRVLVERIRPRGSAYSGLEKWGADRTNPWE